MPAKILPLDNWKLFYTICVHSLFSQQIASKIIQYIIQNIFEFAHLESGSILLQIIVHYMNFNSAI